jgi:hypothetical protein
MGGMAGPNEQLSLVVVLQAVLANVAPVGIAVILLVFRDRRGRFSLSMLLALMTLVALAAWAWGRVLIFR